MFLAIAACAPGCQLVFPLEDVQDKVAHVPVKEETAGAFDLTIDQRVTFDTTSLLFTGVAMGEAGTATIRQDNADSDLALMRVAKLTVTQNGQLVITGIKPLVIIANTIEIDGLVDASADVNGVSGPGGGRPGMGDPGQGGDGANGDAQGVSNSTSGGGGGGFADGAGDGGRVDCESSSLEGGAAGASIGDAQIALLIGGGAGGRGGLRCPDPPARLGGPGGGALQLTAFESITIGQTGRVLAAGGGGRGGVGSAACPLLDGGGGGGGAGGALFVDAPLIANNGRITAFGGGGGGGGGDGVSSDNDGVDGSTGNALTPGIGGAGRPTKGTFGATVPPTPKRPTVRSVSA